MQVVVSLVAFNHPRIILFSNGQGAEDIEPIPTSPRSFWKRPHAAETDEAMTFPAVIVLQSEKQTNKRKDERMDEQENKKIGNSLWI